MNKINNDLYARAEERLVEVKLKVLDLMSSRIGESIENGRKEAISEYIKEYIDVVSKLEDISRDLEK